MDRKNKIDISSSSLVGLKAELYRKQEELRKERLERSSGTPTVSSIPKKTSNIWSKKKKPSKSALYPRKDAEAAEKERLEMEKARSMLEAKSKLYDQITSGTEIPDEQTNNLFLVDFEKKQLDKVVKSDSASMVVGRNDKEEEDVLAAENELPPPTTPDEEWVDYTDSLGRSRRCMRKDLPRIKELDKNLNPDKFKAEPASRTEEPLPEMMSEDMHRDRMRRKWEQEQEDLLNRGQSSIHYQNVRFDEVRNHGVAYYEFAKDEDTRDEQMKTLRYLRDETVDKRLKREELKAKRKAALDARLEKVRQRKKIKTGENSSPDASKPAADDAGVAPEKEPIVGKVEGNVDPNWQRTLRLVEAAKKESLKEDREWDVAKESQSWASQRSQIKNERPSEFAPPPDYTPAAGRRGGKKQFGYREKKIHQAVPPGETSLSGSYTVVPGGGKGQSNTDSRGIGSSIYHVVQLGINTNAAHGHSAQGDTDSQGTSKQQQSSGLPQIPVSNSGEKKNVGERSQVEDETSTQKVLAPAETKESLDGSSNAGLIRTDDSKPIKFSFGGGGRKVEVQRTASCFEEDDIRKEIQSLRQQSS